MDTTQNFEVSTLSSRETNNIIYFPDLVNPPSTNTFINKTDDMDIDYPLEDENALEDFIITETQGFLVKLERELRPRPQFYALTGPGTYPGFYGAGKSETPGPVIEYIKSNCSPFKENEEHKEIIIEIEGKDEKESKKEKKQVKQTKTKQTKITNFTIKYNRKSHYEEKSDNNGETPQKNTRRKSLSTAESSSRKKIKINSGTEDEASKLPEDNSENKRDVEKPKKGSGNNRGRPKGSLNKSRKDSITKNRKSEVDSSLSTSSLNSISSKKSTTSPMTPTREGGLGMILNTDNFIVNTSATMSSAMVLATSSP
ncbi:hypothetical protein C1645_761929 [Glomus cerebriforme]|uniref:Uncharacterized protein n=1 Tax=Glomus cerebriforme TaxID=658196 RepID=A0A397T5R5_9GLOM|nr:hypothetical protein C1645_761929 [Glomus cerebriforme]